MDSIAGITRGRGGSTSLAGAPQTASSRIRARRPSDGGSAELHVEALLSATFRPLQRTVGILHVSQYFHVPRFGGTT